MEINIVRSFKKFCVEVFQIEKSKFFLTKGLVNDNKKGVDSYYQYQLMSKWYVAELLAVEFVEFNKLQAENNITCIFVSNFIKLIILDIPSLRFLFSF